MAPPAQSLNPIIKKIEECSLALSIIRTQLVDVDAGDPRALGRCESKTSEVKEKLNDVVEALRKAASDWYKNLDDLEYNLIRGEQYRDRAIDAERRSEQLANDLKNETIQSSNLKQHIDKLVNDLRHQIRHSGDLQQRINILTDDFNRAQQTISKQHGIIQQQELQLKETQHTSGVDAIGSGSASTLRPSAAGMSRQRSDSGVSDVSSSSSGTKPGDHTRYTLVTRLYDDGVRQYRRGNYAEADATFCRVQEMLSTLPNVLGQTFNEVELAYYRVVCFVERANAADAEKALRGFIRKHVGASEIQLAHVEHLRAVKLVELNRLDEANEQCYAAVDSWHKLDPNSDHYFDAVALMLRLTNLDQHPADALTIINNCPTERRDYVRSRYANLRPATTVNLPALQTNLPSRARTPASPVSPSASVVSNATSGRTKVTIAERRRRRRKELPWLFRIAVPPM